MGLICDNCNKSLKKGQPGRASLLRDEDHLLDLCFNCADIVTEAVTGGKLRPGAKR